MELREQIRNLKLEYKTYPQKELLIAMPNPHPQRDYEIEITSAELTCLCPLNPGQPDYATITISYVPDREIVELKSLKFYLTSYRTVEIFHEDATNRILDELVSTIKPKRMDIIADWHIRGGIAAKIKGSYKSNK